MSRVSGIAIAEEDREIRELLRDCLQYEGFRVDLADGGTRFERSMRQ